RVTRIFQKSVFTKGAPTGPGGTPLRAFCCAHAGALAVARRSHHVGRERFARPPAVRVSPTSASAKRVPGRLRCFGIVLYNEWRNLNVFGAGARCGGMLALASKISVDLASIMAARAGTQAGGLLHRPHVREGHPEQRTASLCHRRWH